MKKYFEPIKKVLIFLIVVFITIFIAVAFEGEQNPLQIATTMTGIFAFFLGSIFVIYIVVNFLTEKSVQFNKLSKVDFLGNKEFYRDILNNYSPVLLAYIDQMRYNYDTSIVTGLLSLQNKGFIEMKEEKINILKYDFYNLSLPERYIIENIKNGKVEILENDIQLKKLIFEEGKRKKLIDSKNNGMEIFEENRKKLKILIITLIIVAIVMNTFILKQDFRQMKIFSDIITFVFIFGFVFICFYTINYQKNPYVRNKNAEELNQKLEGLKNYLKEYSFLDNKEAEDIVVWEDYLIYSVIFNQNQNIILEYKKYYK